MLRWVCGHAPLPTPTKNNYYAFWPSKLSWGGGGGGRLHEGIQARLLGGSTYINTDKQLNTVSTLINMPVKKIALTQVILVALHRTPTLNLR